MLEHLAHGGHKDLLPQIWEKIEDVECLADDIKPLLLTCICNGDYDFALALLERITENTSTNKNGYYHYLERRLFNLMHYTKKVCFELYRSFYVCLCVRVCRPASISWYFNIVRRPLRISHTCFG